MSATQTPTLADVIDAWLQDARASFRVAVPARVQRYDNATKTVTVEPMVEIPARSGDGERLTYVLPIMPSVPVAMPRGGGYFVHMPLNPGDEGLLVFTDTDLGVWRETGAVSDPGDERLHSVGGAVFYPGLSSSDRTLEEAAEHMVIGREDGGPVIHIDEDTVQVGDAGGSKILILGTAVAAWLAAVGTATGAGAFPATGLTTKAKAT